MSLRPTLLSEGVDEMKLLNSIMLKAIVWVMNYDPSGTLNSFMKRTLINERQENLLSFYSISA